MRSELRRVLEELEEDRSLMEPEQIRARLAALDRLDIWFPDRTHTTDRDAAELAARARMLCERLEAANGALYEMIRGEIRRGLRPEILLRWGQSRREAEETQSGARGLGYDGLDELLSGLFGFDAPEDGGIRSEPEKVLYQPTPARLIFDLLEESALTAEDVLVDLGSGLGHVPLLAAICTPARCVGIELEPAYVERARQCAQRLNLDRVAFVQQDAREADLTAGTVFYLYTPFAGSILRKVLDRLREEAGKRRFRVCTYGPCTAMVAREPWLKAALGTDAERIAVFMTQD